LGCRGRHGGCRGEALASRGRHKPERRGENAIAKAVVAGVGSTLGVILTCSVELAARSNLHEVAGEALSSSSALLSACTFSTERKGAGVCDNSRRRCWLSSLSIGSCYSCSDSEE